MWIESLIFNGQRFEIFGFFRKWRENFSLGGFGSEFKQY